MLIEAGAVNVAPAGRRGRASTLEVVIAADPEVIIDCSMGTEAGRATPRLLDAVRRRSPRCKTGRVHPFTSFEALRPGPRIASRFEELARLLHPERF